MLRAMTLTVAILLAFFGAALPVDAQTADDFFNDSVLDRVDLLIHPTDWAKLRENYQINEYYPATLRWHDMTVVNVGIRSRGLGSRSGTKPGLRVDMDRYSSKQTFLGLKSFILDNGVQDHSFMKETVTMKFFQRMGLPAPREAFAALYINNVYAGLYIKVESIDKDFLKRVYGEIDGDTENDGYLFEYNYILDSPYYFSYLGPDLNAYLPRFDP